MKKSCKKIMAVILLAVMVLCMVTGCKKKATPENLLGDIKANMDKVESFGGNMKVSMSMSDDTTSMAVNIDLATETTLKPESAHIDGTIGFNMGDTDMNMDLEMYQVKEDQNDVVYVKVLDQWAKTSGEDSDEIADAEVLKDLSDMAESFTMKKELSQVEGKECFELTGNIKGEEIKSVMDEDLLDSMGVGEMLDLDKLEKAEIPCTIEIYKETVLPARLYIDMSEAIAKITEDAGAAQAVEEYYMEIIYKNYDTIEEIKVPDDVKAAAVSTESAE